jgi:hypothetical protein
VWECVLVELLVELLVENLADYLEKSRVVQLVAVTVRCWVDEMDC